MAKNSRLYKSVSNRNEKYTSWQRKLQRELHDPNRIYEGRPVEQFSVKAVRLG
jgi:hypothetical protein